MVDSGVWANNEYYPQTLLEECKYEIKKNKIENFIKDDIEPGLSDEESDNESDNQPHNDESNEWFVKKYCILIIL